MTPEQTERAIDRARLRGVAEADLAILRTALLEAHRREEKLHENSFSHSAGEYGTISL